MTASVVNPIAELSIAADTGEVRRASTWLEMACIEREIPPEEIRRLDLCLNEALANVIAHSGAIASSFQIRLHLNVSHDQNASEATVTIVDAGAAFDPLAVAPKPRPLTLSEAEPGGLGLLMIRSFADKVNYQYRQDRNQLTFSVLWTEHGNG